MHSEVMLYYKYCASSTTKQWNVLTGITLNVQVLLKVLFTIKFMKIINYLKLFILLFYYINIFDGLYFKYFTNISHYNHLNNV